MDEKHISSEITQKRRTEPDHLHLFFIWARFQSVMALQISSADFVFEFKTQHQILQQQPIDIRSKVL